MSLIWLLLACDRPADDPDALHRDVIALCGVFGQCATEDCARDELGRRFERAPMESRWGTSTRDALARSATGDIDPAAQRLARQVPEVGAQGDLDCALIVALWGEP